MSANDAEQPPQKRSRVSRACDQCRSAREKCEGTHPCHTCAIQKRQCSYNEQPKKRGIQPNYIRTLELTLAWLFRTFPDVEAQLATVLSDESAELPNLITGRDATRTEEFHQAWRTGIVSKQIDQALSGGPIDALQSTATVVDIERRVAEAVSDSANTHFEDAQPDMNTDRPLTKLKLPSDAWTLIEYYWAFTHAWLPIAEKASVLKVVYSYPPDGISVGDASTTEHLELWSIMALAASQLASIGRRADGVIIRDTARSLLPSEYDRAGLGHIKALLLLALLEITNEKWLPAWLLVGSAIRLLSFERASNTPGKFVTNGRSDLVFLVAFVLECAIAGVLHTSTHVRTEDISSIGSMSEDGLEEWSPWLNPLDENPAVQGKVPARSCSTFNTIVRLTMHALDAQSNTINKQFGTGVHAQADSSILGISSNVGRVPNDKSSANVNVVLALTKNASHSASSMQRHPSAVVLPFTGSVPEAGDTRGNRPAPSFRSPVQQINIQSPPQFKPVNSYVSDADNARDVTSALWLQSNSIPMVTSGNDDFDISTTATDIFEELAMLERKDANLHQPQFMQNLGFAPDLDLAEFFGADYLPSDPMLAYMQTGLSNNGTGDQRQDDG